MTDLAAIAEKWQRKWEDVKAFEADAKPGTPKFFCTFPYPYLNGYPHVGHVYSMVRVDIMARYKRMRGFNVLFPQGFHATGSPVVQAAKRVREGEPKQIAILNEMGISDIEPFKQPEHWINFFRPAFEEDFRRMGMSIDWRRSFITTSLNPHYDAFIRWQFNKLREKGHVIKGSFPVVWDPKENLPVGDHDRVEGEGETPQEFVLVKHKLPDGRFVVTATLRPDTILGITNLYAHPDVQYVEAEVAGERWVLGEAAAARLPYLDYPVTLTGTIVKGTDLIGQRTEEFDGHRVLILPATFIDPAFGTGIVHSVPSDSADDLIALLDLQRDPKRCEQFGLLVDEVKAIAPIAVLNTPGLGEFPAQALLDKHKVKNQGEKDKLAQIRQELYTLSHYTATFNEKYSTGFSQDLSGIKTAQGKDIITADLIAKKWATRYYQLTGKVVSRSLTECVVKLVSDQWFLNYSDEHWKRLARECLAQMKLYPEAVRAQFEYVLGWLNNWACTRELGLGTRLPWDSKWVIESLSDSTIYMAYYTIAHLLHAQDASKLDDRFFDYVFHGKGSVPHAEKMRSEFTYWYPMDFRNSGKDLIQNHLAFSIFNHVALFPKSQWPTGFSVNGFVTVDGAKMSKSKGNIILMREMAAKFTPDCARFTIVSGGEYLDDANWDSELARSMYPRLVKLAELVEKWHGKGIDLRRLVDDWMESALNEIIRDTASHMEEAYFRSALQRGYFDLQRALKWYLKRTADQPNKAVMERALKTQVLLLAPFTPFICEELWERMGGAGMVSRAHWPSFDAKAIRPELDELERVMERTLEDIKHILSLAKIEKPTRIELFVASPWMYELYAELGTILKETRSFPDVIKRVMADARFKPHAKEVIGIVTKAIKGGIAQNIAPRAHELKLLRDAIPFLCAEFSSQIAVTEEPTDPKARSALPGKPAILVS